MPKPFTRRTALKMGLVSAFLAACRVVPKAPPLPPAIKYEKRYGLMSAHDTSHGKLFDVIENWPDVRTHEMSWIKMHEAGKIITNASDRQKLSVSRGVPIPFIRSRFHTHLMGTNTILEQKLASIPSPRDVSNFLHFALKHANNPFMLVRKGHVIPISYEGKAVGIVSMRVGKKLLNTMRINMDRVVQKGDFLTLKDTIARMGPLMKLLKRADALEKKYEEGASETSTFFAEYHDLLADLQEAGLQFRVTPRKGYVFQEGYFQSKLLKKV